MNKKLYKLMNWAEIEGIIYSESDEPHKVLGAHVSGGNIVIQAFFPEAEKVRIQPETGDKCFFPMNISWNIKTAL